MVQYLKCFPIQKKCTIYLAEENNSNSLYCSPENLVDTNRGKFRIGQRGSIPSSKFHPAKLKRRGDMNLPICTRIPKVITLELALLSKKRDPINTFSQSNVCAWGGIHRSRSRGHHIYVKSIWYILWSTQLSHRLLPSTTPNMSYYLWLAEPKILLNQHSITNRAVSIIILINCW